MKLIRILFLFFAVILLTPSCSRTNKQLQQAEKLIENAPDSAMTILNTYNYNSLSDKDKALYGLLYTRIQLSKKIILKSDSFINFSIDYYERNNETSRIAYCFLYKGRVYKYAFKYEKAMECYLKALDKTDINSDKALLGRLNFDVADIYSFQSDYELARKRYKQAYKYFMEVGLNKQAFYSLLNIGRTYNLSKNYSSATNYYRKLKTLTNDSMLIGDLLQEIGQNFYEDNKFDSAFLYLYKTIDYPFIAGNKAIRLNFLAKVYFEFQKYDSAIYCCKLAFKYNPDLSIQRENYRIITNCEFIKGNTENVTKYMHKYVALGDTIRKINSQTKGSYIETMHNTQKEVVKSRSWIWYLLAIILFLVTGSVFIYIRKHKKSIQAIEQSRASYSKEKTEMRMDLLLKKRAELLANVERIKSKQKSSDRMDKRVNDAYNELLHIQDAALFFFEMDKSYNNIVTKLRANAPDVKEKELIWCCLQLLDVPTHDILILLDYESINSLKRMKGRLAPKLGLDNAGLLSDYLLNLSTID
jgi:tetratricopeptide (TPR) repeat protein